MAIDDVYALTLNQTYAGQQIMNTLHFRMKTAPDPNDAQLQALATDWKDFFRTQQCDALSYTGWVAQQVRGGDVSYVAKPCARTGGRRLEGLFTGLLPGAYTGEGLPPQCALVTTLYTGLSGRSRRGRHYLGGIAEARQTAGTYLNTELTTYTTAWAAQLAQFTPAGTDPNFALGVWSFTIASGCTARKEPPWGMASTGTSLPNMAFNPVDRVVPRAIVYSQRKRTIGRGR